MTGIEEATQGWPALDGALAHEEADMGNNATVAPGGNSDRQAGAVHAWRVSQLIRLGLADPVAEAIADTLDWHEVAKLVKLGCPAALAVAIVE